MVKLRGQEDYPFYFGAGPELLRIAADLRKSMTPAEKVLWKKLRDKNVKGFRFRRQHPISDFIVDFFCYDSMLVIEIDGDVHDEVYQNERDIQRTRLMRNLGIREIRFRNEEVLYHIDHVISEIKDELSKAKK
jgi:very-short-patch-repair endonuclease